MEKCLSNNQPLSGAISPTQLASIIDIAYQCPSALILQQKFTTGSYFNLQLIRISDIFLIFFYNLK